MIDIKADFKGGLDLDNALYNVAKNAYIDATNVTRDAIEGSNDMALTNIVGNQLINYNFPSGITATPSFVIAGSSTNATITFSGALTIPQGFIINIYLNDLINHSLVCVSTFTTTSIINLNQLTTELANSMVNLNTPGLTGITAIGNQLLFTYPSFTGNDPQYVFDQATINSNGASRNVCIGAYANNLRNTIVYFIWNENDHHLVLEFNNEIRQFAYPISPIFQNLIDSDNVDVLGFTEHNKITSINIYNRDSQLGEGDLLYFLDSLGRPTVMDIMRFKAGEYNPITRDILDVAKKPPLSVMPCLYGNDTTRHNNNLRNKLFRFKYRYVYDNNEKSTCSPISSVPLPVNVLDNNYTNVNTNNNKIDFAFNVGDKQVKSVELLMSYVSRTNNWSDFALIDTVYKSSINLLTIERTVSINQILPDINNASFIFNGSVIAGINIFLSITKLSPLSQIVLGTYTTVDGDTIFDVVNNLYTQMLTLVGTTLEYVYLSGTTTIIIGYYRNDYDFYPYDLSITYPPYDIDNSYYSYAFYNDSTYPVIDINESILIYDYVPETANAQEMPNGNVLLYGGITEGYNRDLLPNVVNEILTTPGTGVPIGSLNIVPTFIQSSRGEDDWLAQFSGIALTGTTIKLRLLRLSDSVVVNAVDVIVLSTWNTLFLVVSNCFANMGLLGIVHGQYYTTGGSIKWWYETDLYDLLGWEVVPPGSTLFNSTPTFLFSTQRKIGIAYFDNKGKTNGILYNGNLSLPAYSEDVLTQVLLPYVNTKVYHQPPEWAYSYNFYLTKEATQFLYWEIINVVTTETDYLFFDISNLQINQNKYPTTTNVLNYTFQDGDRMRLIRRVSDNTVFSDLYDAAIEGQVKDPGGSVPPGTYIKIRANSSSLFASVDYTSKYFIIQLYRPEQQLPNPNNEVYYEFGQQYFIGNPTLPSRYHMGMVSNQNISINAPAEFNFYEGGVYYRSRTISISEAATDEYFAIDSNFVDNYISAVNSIDGRPSIIDINARRAYYSTLVRFSEAYQANTNINGTNRFFPNNFDEYDYSYGDVMRFTTRDRFIRVFQKLKIGQVPLYHQILKEQNKENLIVSDKLLNPIQYYVGDVGIGNNSESLASYRFADYFTSNIKGVICRVSNDGVMFLSVDHNIDSWASTELPFRTGEFKVYGTFDPILGNYIAALEETTTQDAYTLIFDEKNNSFDTFLSFHPEMMATLRTLFVSFKNGQIYTHDSPEYNNFYGNQYDSSITMVFNASPMVKKTFLALSEIGSDIWETPEMKTDLNSYGTIKMQTNLVSSDFAQLEGTYEATILRDQNSVGGLIEGDSMKGKLMTVKFRSSNASQLVSLNLVSLKYINSPLTNT